MGIHRRPASSNRAQKITNDEQEQEINRLNVSEKKLYESCLKTLESKFQERGKELFYQSFANTYQQIYNKSRESKKRYWSKTSIILLVLGTGGSGTVAVVGLFSFARALFSASAESDTLWRILLSCAPVLVPFSLALGLFVACLFTEFKRRDYKSTWVRHSATYHRLNITMIRYLSNLISEEDFMKEVLHILEANIDRFERTADDSHGTNT